MATNSKEKDEIIRALKTELKELREKVGEDTEFKRQLKEEAVGLYQNKEGTFFVVKLLYDFETKNAAISEVTEISKDFHRAAMKARDFFEMNVVLGTSKR